MIADLLDADGTALAAELGAQASFVHLDVTKPSEWDQAVKHSTSTFGSLDVLVNNAGIDRVQATTGRWIRVIRMTRKPLSRSRCQVTTRWILSGPTAQQRSGGDARWVRSSAFGRR